MESKDGSELFLVLEESLDCAGRELGESLVVRGIHVPSAFVEETSKASSLDGSNKGVVGTSGLGSVDD
jgi:hypothetical protein